ncbi:MAG TPA: hypothetical protein VGF17_04200, partial [Phytomonospora sp.]
MTSPVLVDTVKIRAAATKITALAPKAAAVGAPVQKGATEAATANRGYYTSSAVTNFAQQVVAAGNAIQQVLSGHATKMNACATAWDA